MENQTNKKRRLLAWTLAALVALSIVSAIVLLSMPLDLTRFSGRIEAAIEARVNGKVKLGSVIVKALPSPEVTVTGIEARHKGRIFFLADRVHARAGLLDLLTGKASFEAIEADNPALLLARDREGRVNISDFLKKEGPAAKAGKSRKLSIDYLRIEGGSFDFIDRFPMQTAIFSLTNITASSAITDKGTGFTATATLAPETPVSLYGLVDGPAIQGQAIIEDLSLAAFNEYIRPPTAVVKGLVDLDLSYKFDKVLVTKGPLEYRQLEASYPSTWVKPLVSPSGSAVLTLKIGEGLFDLTVDDILINMKGFSAKGSLRLVGPRNQKVMDLVASSTPVDMKSFLDLLPARKMPKEAARRVLSIKPLSGTVTVKDLRLAGKVREMKGTGLLTNPEIYASASVKDASFAYNGIEQPFTGVSGALEFKGGVLKFAALNGRYGKQTIERLDGRMKDLAGDGAFELDARATLDIRETLEMAAANVPSAKERIEAVDAEGAARVSAKVSGSLKRKELIRYSGTASVANGSAYYDGLPIGFDSVDASVDFNNNSLKVSSARVRSDSSVISLSGSIENYRGDDPRVNIRSEGSLTAETLSKATGKGPSEMNMTGPVLFTLSAEGRKGDFQAKASADATATGLFVERFIDKAPGVSLKAEARGRLKGQTATIESATITFGNSVVKGAGTKKLDGPDFSASVASERLDIADIDSLSQRMDRKYKSSGTLAFDVKAARGPGQESASYEGRASVIDGSFDTGLLPNPVKNANARAMFGSNAGTLIIDRVETGSTVITGRVNVLDMTGRVLRFELDLPYLHAEDLVPVAREKQPDTSWIEDEESAKDGAAPKTIKTVSGYGSVRAAEGDLWGHEFASLSADARIGAGKIEIDPVALDIDGGKATAKAVIFLDEAEARLFVADMAANGILLERLTSARTARKVLNGNARGAISLVGMKGDGPLTSRLYGKASAVVTGGRLWKFGFITDIFSFVNIISLDELFKKGLPYKKINGEFTIDRGIVSTSQLTFDSDSLRMSAIGTLSLPDKEIDLTLALHPFVTIDKIITSIPLVGWIITGTEESTVSFYFDVQGPAADPSITPLPVKTIEKSVFGILERLLKLPLKLFE